MEPQDVTEEAKKLGETKVLDNNLVAAVLLEDSLKIEVGENIFIILDSGAADMKDSLVGKCLAKGAVPHVMIKDDEATYRFLETATKGDVDAYLSEEKRLMELADKLVMVRAVEKELAQPVGNEDIVKYFHESKKAIHADRVAGRKDWTLFYKPTEFEAKNDDMTLDEAESMVMSSLRRSKKEVERGNKILAEKLDKAITIHIVLGQDNPDPRTRTDITFDIANRTFCESNIDRNVPGSEVFSAPNREGVNGQIYAEGTYIYRGIKMKNIFLKFENGKIVDASAEENNEALQSLLNEHEQNRFLGELAFGTNPGFPKRILANPLYCEKIAGTIHFAIGESYEYTEYGGKTVNVNNGNNDATIHWDIPVAIFPQAEHDGVFGIVYLDDEPLLVDGRFVDPELQMFNRN